MSLELKSKWWYFDTTNVNPNSFLSVRYGKINDGCQGKLINIFWSIIIFFCYGTLYKNYTNFQIFNFILFSLDQTVVVLPFKKILLYNKFIIFALLWNDLAFDMILDTNYWTTYKYMSSVDCDTTIRRLNGSRDV